MANQMVSHRSYPNRGAGTEFVSCHNTLQPGPSAMAPERCSWVNFVFDVRSSPFRKKKKKGLAPLMWQSSSNRGWPLFSALALAGLIISLIHFRQLKHSERVLGGASAERQKLFLDTIIENMPVFSIAGQGRAETSPTSCSTGPP